MQNQYDYPVKHSASPPRQGDSPFRILPCLRCGKMGIHLVVPATFEKLEIGDLQCEHCSAPHYLSAQRQSGTWRVMYDRYTIRYPSEHYDEFPHFRAMLR